MNPRLNKSLVALLGAGAATLALAQAPAATADNANPAPALAAQNTAQGGIASTSGGSGPNAEAAHAIAQALNAESSLQGSKLTVVPEENGILVTGVTPKVTGMARIINIAQQHAGGGTVSTAISTEEVFIDLAANAVSPEVMAEGTESAQPRS